MAERQGEDQAFTSLLRSRNALRLRIDRDRYSPTFLPPFVVSCGWRRSQHPSAPSLFRRIVKFGDQSQTPGPVGSGNLAPEYAARRASLTDWLQSGEMHAVGLELSIPVLELED